MTLLEKQFHFSVLLARFVWELTDKGYGVSLGEGFRPEWVAAIYAKQGKGVINSLHCLRLAQDLNLFKNSPDSRLLSSVEEYREAGNLWKSYSSLEVECCWGGDFVTRADADHFSISHNGVR